MPFGGDSAGSTIGRKEIALDRLIDIMADITGKCRYSMNSTAAYLVKSD
jgi:hypothetical protein